VGCFTKFPNVLDCSDNVTSGLTSDSVRFGSVLPMTGLRVLATRPGTTSSLLVIEASVALWLLQIDGRAYRSRSALSVCLPVRALWENFIQLDRRNVCAWKIFVSARVGLAHSLRYLMDGYSNVDNWLRWGKSQKKSQLLKKISAFRL
jgi:hypothetical protein